MDILTYQSIDQMWNVPEYTFSTTNLSLLQTPSALCLKRHGSRIEEEKNIPPFLYVKESLENGHKYRTSEQSFMGVHRASALRSPLAAYVFVRMYQCTCSIHYPTHNQQWHTHLIAGGSCRASPFIPRSYDMCAILAKPSTGLMQHVLFGVTGHRNHYQFNRR